MFGQSFLQASALTEQDCLQEINPLASRNGKNRAARGEMGLWAWPRPRHGSSLALFVYGGAQHGSSLGSGPIDLLEAAAAA